MISITYPVSITGSVVLGNALPVSGAFNIGNTFEMTGNAIMSAVNRDVDKYTGDYTVTPTSFTQTLNTNDLLMTDNITVNPIPSNYGLITWNGSSLTVS